jgi:hypothetical protein
MTSLRISLLLLVAAIAASAQSQAEPGQTLAHMMAQMTCQTYGYDSDVCRSAQKDITRGNSGETLARMQARMTCQAFGESSQACLSAKRDVADAVARHNQPFAIPQYRSPYLGAPSASPGYSQASSANNTITFINRSGEPALVKLRGATTSEIYVPNGTSSTLHAFGGTHYILARYGAAPPYTYSRGESFAVTETRTQYSEISITLHKVVDGNYDSRTISAAEFESK